MGGSFALDGKLLTVVLGFLFMFGWGFHYFVNSLGKRKEGYLALFVVAGVLVTLGGAALINWQAAALVLACFFASGTPMIVGEVFQTIWKRDMWLRLQVRKAEEDLKDILDD